MVDGRSKVGRDRDCGDFEFLTLLGVEMVSEAKPALKKTGAKPVVKKKAEATAAASKIGAKAGVNRAQAKPAAKKVEAKSPAKTIGAKPGVNKVRTKPAVKKVEAKLAAKLVAARPAAHQALQKAVSTVPAKEDAKVGLKGDERFLQSRPMSLRLTALKTKFVPH